MQVGGCCPYTLSVMSLVSTRSLISLQFARVFESCIAFVPINVMLHYQLYWQIACRHSKKGAPIVRNLITLKTSQIRQCYSMCQMPSNLSPFLIIGYALYWGNGCYESTPHIALLQPTQGVVGHNIDRYIIYLVPLGTCMHVQ